MNDQRIIHRLPPASCTPNKRPTSALTWFLGPGSTTGPCGPGLEYGHLNYRKEEEERVVVINKTGGREGGCKACEKEVQEEAVWGWGWLRGPSGLDTGRSISAGGRGTCLLGPARLGSRCSSKCKLGPGAGSPCTAQHSTDGSTRWVGSPCAGASPPAFHSSPWRMPSCQPEQRGRLSHFKSLGRQLLLLK